MKKLIAFCAAAAVLVGVAGAFTACETPTENTNISHVTRLSGTIDDVDTGFFSEGDPYTLKLEVPVPESELGEVETVASCPISEGGVFSLDLPETIDQSLLMTSLFKDESSIAMSDPGLKTSLIWSVDLAVFDGGDQWTGHVYYSASGGNLSIIYADRDCRVSGRVTFPTEGPDGSEMLSDTYDLNLKRGWNWILSEDRGSNFHLVTKIPTGAKFYLSIPIAK
jgi:hypothetical protein